MHFGKLFRQGNTCRVTIPLILRHALKLNPGDIVVLNLAREGVVELRNATLQHSQLIKKDGS